MLLWFCKWPPLNQYNLSIKDIITIKANQDWSKIICIVLV